MSGEGSGDGSGPGSRTDPGAGPDAGLGAVSEGPSGRIAVLVADGDPASADRMAAGLEAADDRIDAATATTAGAALDRLSEPSVDCLVAGDDAPDRADLLSAADRAALPAVLFGRPDAVPAAGAPAVADAVPTGNAGDDDAHPALAAAVTAAVADRRARRERERTIERYETILDALGDPVYVLDADGRYTYINDAHADRTGYPRGEIIGEHVSLVLPEESVRLGRETIRELLAAEDRSQATVEMERRTADGGTILVENHIALLPTGPDGEFRGSAGVARDISDRKARERELERRNRQFEAVFDNPVAFVALLEPDGTTLRVNRTANAFVGADPGDFAGVPFPETPFWTHSAALQDDLRGWIDRAAGGDLVQFEAEHYAPDGERVVIDGTLYPVVDDAGTVTELVVAGRDVTDREDRERELERQNERLAEFAGVVSHDLRNPLNVAEGRLDLARAAVDGADADAHSEHFDAVAGAHDRMRALIDDLLTLAERGETVDDIEPVALPTLLADAWAAVCSDAATLRVETEATVLADPGRLRQLFENLFRNSVEHGSTGSRPAADDSVEHAPDVTVTVGDVDGDTPDERGFYVADDGPGIPADDREHVFEAGYSTADDGTGFGLSIVREIAEAHGWTIAAADSDAGGARFEITGVEFA